MWDLPKARRSRGIRPERGMEIGGEIGGGRSGGIGVER